MNSAREVDRQKARLQAFVRGSIAAFATVGAVAWSTTDGNLVVTLVPPLAVGLLVFGIELWRFRRVQLE